MSLALGDRGFYMGLGAPGQKKDHHRPVKDDFGFTFM